MKARQKKNDAAATVLLPADRDLFAAYRRFVAAYEKVKEADTPDMQAGSVNEGTRAQKRQHALWESRVHRACKLAFALITMPAYTLEGMLLKIQVQGYRQTAPGKNFRPTIEGPDWTLHPPHASSEHVLLAGLRDDLRRIRNARCPMTADLIFTAIAAHRKARGTGRAARLAFSSPIPRTLAGAVALLSYALEGLEGGGIGWRRAAFDGVLAALIEAARKYEWKVSREAVLALATAKRKGGAA